MKEASFRSLKQITAGIHACKDALLDGREIDRVFIRKGAKGPAFEEIIANCKERKIPCLFVPAEKLDRLTNVSHQGIVALHALIEYQEVEDIIPFIYEQGKDPLCLVLDRVTDVRNLGAMVRTAECMGAHCVIIPDRGGAEINAEAIKSSAGALGRLPVCRTPDLAKTLKYLQQTGLQVVGASEKGQHLLFEAHLSGPLAVVMGSEGDGLSSEVKNMLDAVLRIPMTGLAGSLNVGVASAMFLYEAVKQRKLEA